MDRVAVILWIYNTDLADEFVSLLSRIKRYIRVYLQLCQDNNNEEVIKLFRQHNIDHSITIHKNYGMDVLPFVEIIDSIKESFFIKIHSKNSTFGNFEHMNWRVLLLDSLIGSERIFLNNYTRIFNDSKIGMIGNENLLMDTVGTNGSIITNLCSILNVDTNFIGSYFFGGNMFLSRTQLFQKYFNSQTLQPIKSMLNENYGKLSDHTNGTAAHSLERLFGYIVSNENLNLSPAYHHISLLKKSENSQISHLVKLYNNECYLIEDVIEYGKIINQTPTTLSIQWYNKNIDNYTIDNNIYLCQE